MLCDSWYWLCILHYQELSFMYEDGGEERGERGRKGEREKRDERRTGRGSRGEGREDWERNREVE